LCGSGCQQKSDFETQLNKAEAGDVEAQTSLGWMYAKGEGVAEDYAEAFKWFRKAADQGYAEAQYILGLNYYTGLGVPKDNVEAVKWFRKAAEQGHSNGQFDLGVMYYNGEGARKDIVEAYKWLNLSAAQGNEEAKKNRQIIAKEMTKEQIGEAERLASEFKPSPTPASN
tara:strand:- start:53 stop:562 length:510 start_codon:yes stop_codon:yes gene_type:complete